MALDSEGAWPPPTASKTPANATRLAEIARRASAIGAHIWAAFCAFPPIRFANATLVRRIFISNILGLVIIIGGIFWLSQQEAWLITAKRESLKVQGEIIASAISSAMIDRGHLAFDPDRLQEVDRVRVPMRDDGFSSIELSLRPERVIPVLNRLILPGHNTRARVYERNGKLIIDSQDMAAGRFGPPIPQDPPPEGEQKLRVKNFWTRMTALFDRTDLPVYREIGTANGRYYPEVRQALRGTALPPMLLLNDEGQKIVSLAVPIQRRNSTLGVLLLSTRPGEIDHISSAERHMLLLLTLMAVGASLLTAMVLDRTIAGPVKRLSASAESVSRSINARHDLPEFPNRQDEVAQLAESFRHMTAALYRRIESSEKFAADVAHELKNPLTAAQSVAQALHYARTAEQRDQLVEQIQAELKRLNRLITDVSNASRLDAELARQQTEPVDVRAVVDGVVGVFQDMIEDGKSRLRVDIPNVPLMSDAFVVMAHEGRLGQVVTNLIDNAISFSPEHGAVTVTLRRIGGEVEFVVEDEGPGIPEGSLDKIFDRFYSDRPQSDQTRGKNSGLGLSISREIITAHKGRIWAENRMVEGRVAGARLAVRLPAGQPGQTRGGPGGGHRA